ncbi:MAG: GMC family oxidoreductase N-terminal domain-containing protein [Elusimicrobiota bacterium]
MDVYDIAVVGSGAGGACVAGETARAGARVVLIEQGGSAKVFAGAQQAVSTYYRSGGYVSAVGNAILPIPTGVALGGTTIINSGTCMRTPRPIVEHWTRKSHGAFDADDFEKCLDLAWTRLKVRRAPERTLSKSSRAVIAGAKHLGLTAEPLDRCETGCEGLGRCCFVCPTDAKMTSYKAFLDDVASGVNLDLLCHTRLLDIDYKKSGITLRVSGPQGDGTITCRRLVLACGALATPYFVRSFRLAPNWVAAGNNLSVHPASKVFAYFDERIEGWKGVPQGAGFDDPRYPDLRFEGVYTPPELAALTMPLEGSRLSWWMQRYAHVATFGYMIKDSSRGFIRYPAGPENPFIYYHFNRADSLLLAQGARRVAEVFFAAGARRVVVPVNRAGNELGGSDELARLDLEGTRVRHYQLMAFHPLGTCAMGRVAGWNLELMPDVFVCDGSVIPESLGVNPQITIYALALRLARHLKS